MSVREKMTAIADNIRARAGISGKLNLDQMAAAVDDVYNSGYNAGYDGLYLWANEQYNVGLEDGKRAVWHTLQRGGVLGNYYSTFLENDPSNPRWTDETFTPYYNFLCTNCNQMFRGTGITDLPAILERRGLKLDTSNSTAFSNMFAYSKFIKHIGEIDTRSASSLNDMFAYTEAIEKIDNLILKEEGTQTIARAFDAAQSLVNITIDGVIGYDGINFKWSTKLSRASIESIVNALSTTVTTKPTITFSKTAVNKAFSADEWEALKATRDNWTFVLA